MDQTLIDFVRVLRNAEVRVSPAETLDALHAVQVLGVDRRDTVRHALAVSLAKTEHDKEVFEASFAQFFSQRGLDAETLAAPLPDETELESLLAGPSPGGEAVASSNLSTLSQLLLDGDDNALAMSISQGASEIALEQIRFFTQKGQFSRRLMEAMGLQDLDRDIHALEQAAVDLRPGRAEAKRLKNGRQRLWDHVSDHVEQHYLLYARQNELQLRDSVLRNTRLSSLEKRDLHRLHLLVRRIARRLAARYSRRRRVMRKGQLDVPRTLRAGTATDGILFQRHWRWRRRDRPTVVVMCDISGSVRAYARFLLLFLYSLNEVLPRIRSFVFCSQATEVSDLFRDFPAQQAIDTALSRYATGSTDYGRSLRELLGSVGRGLDQGGTLIILGDARNNYGDPELPAMRELARRSRRLLWLNPELPSSWSSGDSEMHRYATFCSAVFNCRSLADLERFASRLLRENY